MNKIQTNPDLELLDPIAGKIRNQATGEVFHVSSEVLQLLTFFSQPRDVGVKFGYLGDLLESDDVSALREYIRDMLRQRILVRLGRESTLRRSVVSVSDISLTERPATSFFSLPVVDLKDKYQYHLALMGMPFDLGSTGYPGSRYGPSTLRRLSHEGVEYKASFVDHSVRGWYTENGRELCVGKRIVDIGDVIHQVGEPFHSFFDRAGKVVASVIKHGAVPVVVGGDHSCLYPIIKSVSKSVKGRVRLIVFDAHTDLADYDAMISHNHGNVISRIVSEGIVTHVSQVGLRGMLGRTPSGGHYDYLCSGDCVESSAILEHLRINQGENVYISFDVDVIDPTFAPGTGTPVPCGLHPTVVLGVLTQIIQKTKVLGLDVVEYNPMRDVSDATGNLLTYMLPRLLDSFRID